MRLQERKLGREATYGEVRDNVYQDWKEDMSGKLTSQAVRELSRKYRIQNGGGA